MYFVPFQRSLHLIITCSQKINSQIPLPDYGACYNRVLKLGTIAETLRARPDLKLILLCLFSNGKIFKQSLPLYAIIKDRATHGAQARPGILDRVGVELLFVKMGRISFFLLISRYATQNHPFDTSIYTECAVTQPMT